MRPRAALLLTFDATSTLPKRRNRPSQQLPFWLVMSSFVLMILVLQVLLILHHSSSTKVTPVTPTTGGRSRHKPISPRNSQIFPLSKTVVPDVEAKAASRSTLKEQTHTSQLPLWIRNYIAWHNAMIQKYPGTDILTNPNAPKILVRTCLGLCGGLHDRLGQLPWDLYLANQTGRLLFVKWVYPRPLEKFLVPNEFNWTLPLTHSIRSFNMNVKTVTNMREMFEGFLEDQPVEEFWKTSLDVAIRRATVGEFKDIRLLRHRLLGHLDEKELEQRLQQLGETDMLHWTPSFGHIFGAFFKPSPDVATKLKQVYNEFGLQPGKYSAIHCRVRHPKATPSNVYVMGKSNVSPADKSGLPWYGSNRDFAVTVATKAVYCARTLQEPGEPIYFFSDSNDLVRFMAHELTDPEYRTQNASFFENLTDANALKSIEGIRLIARDGTEENVHIDRQKGRPVPAYYGTFVDFWLAIHARCVTYGIGYFAIFAVKISGITCKQVYHEEEWGGKEGTKVAPMCTKDTYAHLL